VTGQFYVGDGVVGFEFAADCPRQHTDDPCAVQPRVPIWVGGRTRRSLRRAVELGDGWTPFGLRASDITKLLAAVELPQEFDVVLPTPALDPIGAPADTAAAAHAARPRRNGRHLFGGGNFGRTLLRPAGRTI
jgi:alkanesulfonate monooxygenase SsuD/methylene tetrahydromethanopterin reductase-like flavin-dependent oxidoreductase (luciferase family)